MTKTLNICTLFGTSENLYVEIPFPKNATVVKCDRIGLKPTDFAHTGNYQLHFFFSEIFSHLITIFYFLHKPQLLVLNQSHCCTAYVLRMCAV